MRRYKVGVLSSTRADYGHLYWLLQALHGDVDIELLLYVTGSHLAPELGHTVDQIDSDGIPVHRRIPIQQAADEPADVAISMGTALIEFGKVLTGDQPDLMVMLGDRFEVVPVALACVLHNVPVAHIHGGELSTGALDDSFRHAITKLARLHFPAADEYARRIRQMGEDPKTVHTFGAPGLDHLYRTAPLSRDELQAVLELDLSLPTAVVTYHPVTTEPGRSFSHVAALLAAVEEEENLQAVFTKANADSEGTQVNRLLEDFCRLHPGRFKLFGNLGVRVYHSALRELDLMIGNSSSGLIEAPSFALPVVNIGTRQDGRIKARNVIDVPADKGSIRDGMRVAMSAQFRQQLVGMTNPYDRYADGNVSARIAQGCKRFLERPHANKRFVDVDVGIADVR